MKIVITICVLAIIAGCGALITPENPFGFQDPNQVQMLGAATVSAGHTTQAIGTATGNPAMIGIGALLVVVGGIFTKKIMKG